MTKRLHISSQLSSEKELMAVAREPGRSGQTPRRYVRVNPAAIRTRAFLFQVALGLPGYPMSWPVTRLISFLVCVSQDARFISVTIVLVAR